MVIKNLLAFILTALLAMSAASAESATIVADTALYQRPSIQSSIVQQLQAGAQVEINARSGGWKQVSAKNSFSGWVRSYQVRSGIIKTGESQPSSGGFFSGLANLSRRASGLFSSGNNGYSFQRTATIGVRGLSEEEIKNAKPDLQQLKKMEGYRSSKRTSKKFAQLGKRTATKVNHMPKSSQEK